MKHLHHHLMLATALAAGLVVAAPLVISQVSAEGSARGIYNAGLEGALARAGADRAIAGRRVAARQKYKSGISERRWRTARHRTGGEPAGRRADCARTTESGR